MKLFNTLSILLISFFIFSTAAVVNAEDEVLNEKIAVAEDTVSEQEQAETPKNNLKEKNKFITALAMVGSAPLGIPYELVDGLANNLTISAGAYLTYWTARVLELPWNLITNGGNTLLWGVQKLWFGFYRGAQYVFDPEVSSYDLSDIKFNGEWKKIWGDTTAGDFRRRAVDRFAGNAYNSWMAKNFYVLLGKDIPKSKLSDAKVAFAKLLTCNEVDAINALIRSATDSENSYQSDDEDTEYYHCIESDSGDTYRIEGVGLGTGLFYMEDGSLSMIILDLNPFGDLDGHYLAPNVGLSIPFIHFANGYFSAAVGELGTKWILGFGHTPKGAVLPGAGVQWMRIEKQSTAEQREIQKKENKKHREKREAEDEVRRAELEASESESK